MWSFVTAPHTPNLTPWQVHRFEFSFRPPLGPYNKCIEIYKYTHTHAHNMCGARVDYDLIKYIFMLYYY